MIDIFDVFNVKGPASADQMYAQFGYPRNPFREASSDQINETGPFFTGHIVQQLQEIQGWVASIHSGSDRQPMSLVGNIGAGKTRILRFLLRRLSNFPAKEKVVAELLLLSDTGYARASVGGMLVSALERMQIHQVSPVPDGVLPLVWAIVTSDTFPAQTTGVLGASLQRTHQEKDNNAKQELAMYVSRWLQRSPLTSSQATRVGLHRRIDWEGELVKIIGDLFRLAEKSGVVKTFYLFVDQLEDLFRPTFSELRRSRILTDLRGLVDEIDAGMPVGLLLAWTPEFNAAPISLGNEVDAQFRSKYEALYSRMRRRRVDLPLLKREDAFPFAEEWINALRNEAAFDASRQPDLTGLVASVWERLRAQRKLYPGGGGSATPRDLLTGLASEVDQVIGIA